MSISDIETLRMALQSRWPSVTSDKARKYVGQFSNTIRVGTKITGQVVGNHGTYTVSIHMDGAELSSACSCYIGKHGYCHHCAALAITFLNDATAFKEVKIRQRREVDDLPGLGEYLKGTTLESLLTELKAHGMTQKAFAESIGMSPRHLSAIRSSELRNHYFNELGATKLACLWVLEHFAKT